ncbi:uncharacterized protein LOC112270038 isoform X2 [Brachypodium distachyon]|uniref:uncharacterized protein LOC112270038 isoform X2 n=1 Tax=Brachypodium distachyon TaxID=15368 RepID=UPI000D0D13C8|nr:uncharacterized protein LOC112270038 isoform X2 [Brachypodium distachyon]|eukprot:XP_024313453.1 uncharacterized protein LOC112270038 isoform X2 [Brachypodium distachyon]
MRVLNWMQNRLHGARCSNKNSEFSTGSNQPADTSVLTGPHRDDDDDLHDRWAPVMLSIGTFGVGEGRDALKKLQQELTLIMSAKAEEREEDKRRHHLLLERSLNGDGRIVKHRSFRKLVTSVVRGFLPRPRLRGTMPGSRPIQIPLPLLYMDILLENSASSDMKIKNYQTAVQFHSSRDAEKEQEIKWIRTDSEYIVLEI